ncbi:hypothetical protein MHN28_09210 [Ruegeria sp. Ofav3-42]|nr:hypothetical protein [Ruegeria sp. Ofav3-42]
MLQMDGEALARHLVRAAARNPFLRLRNPKPPNRIAAENVTATDSLYAHVLQQIRTAFRDPCELRVAIALTEALEPTGWLGRDLTRIADETKVTLVKVEQVLTRCQQLEPTGVFARNLAECLRLQLIELGKLQPRTERVLRNLSAILDGGADALALATGLAPEQIEEALRDIRLCDPKPGASLQPPDPTLRRRPDVLVFRDGDNWLIELDREALPRLSLSESSDGEDPAFVRLQADARSLIGAVRLRNQMTLRVARAVVSSQIGYLERGTEGLTPLRRCDIAQRLEISESTVSRVVRGLLVQTPRGLIDLARFFSRPLGRSGGPTESRRHLQERLRHLILTEDSNRPMTDQDLAHELARSGARVSRRTVAKYRQLLEFPGVHERSRP